MYGSNLLHELRKQRGTGKCIGFSAAFRFEVPERRLPRLVQELQIGGTRLARVGGERLSVKEMSW
jgi:hypothetical protein